MSTLLTCALAGVIFSIVCFVIVVYIAADAPLIGDEDDDASQ